MDPKVGAPDRERLERAVRIVLKASRQDRDLSQKELAQKMGWSRNQVANLESGRRVRWPRRSCTKH